MSTKHILLKSMGFGKSCGSIENLRGVNMGKTNIRNQGLYRIHKSLVCIVLILTACGGLQQRSDIDTTDHGAVIETNSGTSDNSITTVFLVRHAEPDTKPCPPPIDPSDPCPVGADPCLSIRGKARAEQLVQVLKKAGIKAIYSTKCHRTWETAQPLSEALTPQLTINGYRSVNQLVDKVRSDHIGQRILVASHSGMVEDIISALNGDGDECRIENEFDNLCVVTLYDGDKAEVVNLQYGEPSNGLPDLIVASLTHSPAKPKTTDRITFTAVVKNIGRERAGPSTLSFRIGGETKGKMYDVPALRPGETFTVKRQKTFSTAQNYRNTAIADVNNAVRESDENNNKRTDDFTVIVIECRHGHERYVRCMVGGRPGFRRDRCVNGVWRKGQCKPGVIP